MALTTYHYPKASFSRRNYYSTDRSEVSDFVSNKISSFHDIDVNEASKNMRQVAQLLQLAYAASIGQTCNRPIMDILKNYLVLMGETMVVKGVCASIIWLYNYWKPISPLMR